MNARGLTRGFACSVGAIAVALLGAGPASAAFLTPEYAFTVSGSGPGAIGEPLAVAVDEATHDFYVADRGNHRIEKFDSAGNFILSFGGGAGEFPNPSSIAVDNSDGPSQGDVYVAEGGANGGDNTVSKFDGSGQPVSGWGTGGTLEVREVRKMTVSPYDGNVWVVDGVQGESPGATDGGHIIALTENGVQKSRIETRGDGGTDGTVAIDSHDRLWFSDHNEVANIFDISRYGETGNHSLGTISPGSASHFALNPVDDDVLAVFNGSEVKVFEGSCDPFRGFCEPRETFGAGQLSEPKGLAIDGSDRSVYIAIGGGVAVFRSKVVPDVLPKPAAVGHSDAVIGAHLDPIGAGPIVGCEVEYGPTTDYGSTAPCDQAMPLANAADVTAHLAGLTTETPYHYRFRATNGNGTSNGLDRVLTPHWVSGLETGDATAVTAGTATLHGELDPEATSTSYYFEWGTSKSYGKVAPQLPGSETTAAGLTQVETDLTGVLTGLTTYHYRLTAVGPLGTSHGADREFTTPLGEAPQVTSVSARPTSPTTAVLEAEINPGFGDTAYRFQYGPSPAYGHNTVIGPPLANDGSFHRVSLEVAGLEPGITYHLRLVAFNFVDRVTSSDMTFDMPDLLVARPAPEPVPPQQPVQPGPGQGKAPVKCKRGFVRKKGKCVKKPRRHRQHKAGSKR